MPPAPVCPPAWEILEGYDDEGERAGWTLQGSVARRVPVECLSRSVFDDESDEVEPSNAVEESDFSAERFSVGDLDGDGAREGVVVREYAEDEYVVGREARIVGVAGEIAVLRDRHMRFASSVVPAGDVNGDGHIDLLITRPSACDCCDCSGMSDDVLLYLALPAGGYVEPVVFQGQDGIQNIILALGVGDTNRDGYADVVIAHGSEFRLHHGSRAGLETEGQLVHTRTESGMNFAIQPLRNGWWWIDEYSPFEGPLRAARRKFT